MPNTCNDDDLQDKSWKIKLSRACLLITVFWLQFGCGWQWMVQASTERQTKIYYGDISSEQYRLLNEIYLYVYIFTGPIGMYIVDRHFTLGVFLGSFFQGIGSIVIFFAKSNYWFHFSANALCAFAQCLLFPCPGLMAEKYFSKKIAPDKPLLK